MVVSLLGSIFNIVIILIGLTADIKFFFYGRYYSNLFKLIYKSIEGGFYGLGYSRLREDSNNSSNYIFYNY